MITTNEFIKKTKGKRVPTPNGNLPGECVSLINAYLYECLEIPSKARGNADDLDETLIKENIAYKVDKMEYGDILIWNPKDDKRVNQKYGHCGLYFDGLYDQNSGYHDDKKCGFSPIMFDNTVILRTNKRPIIEKDMELGVYETLTDMNLRTGAGTSNSKVKYEDMTTDGKKNALYKENGANAVYKKGTRFNVYEIKTLEDTSIWGRGRSGWLCLTGSTGVVLCEFKEL